MVFPARQRKNYSVWGARRLSFGSRANALLVIVCYGLQVGGACLGWGLAGGTLVGEVFAGGANEAEVVLFTSFFLLRKQLAVGP